MRLKNNFCMEQGVKNKRKLMCASIPSQFVDLENPKGFSNTYFWKLLWSFQKGRESMRNIW